MDAVGEDPERAELFPWLDGSSRDLSFRRLLERTEASWERYLTVLETKRGAVDREQASAAAPS